MGDVDTGTQKSGLTNPAMQAAATTIGNQLNTQLSSGVKPYDQSMVPGLSGQTTQGVNSLSNNPNNAAFGGAMGSTIKDFGAIASGQRFGMNDPGYASMREGALDDAMTGVGSSFLTDGRFGSSVMGDAAGTAATQTLAGLDYQNFQNDQQRQMQAAGMLPGLYQGSQLPGMAQLQAGQTMDAWNSAKAQDDARRFDATQNAGWNTLQRGSSIFAGTAPVSGTTTTESQPWWKVGTGLGSTFLGMA